MSNELTKAAIDKVVQVTGMKAQTVRDLLETGWTLSWNMTGDFRWDRNERKDLMDYSKIGPLFNH